MKYLLKKVLSERLLIFLRRIRLFFPMFFRHMHEMYRELCYSATFRSDKTSDLSRLFIKTHVLEKGLSMPDRRLGFGMERIHDIIQESNKSIKKYGDNHVEIQAALAALNEYLVIHDTSDFVLPENITNPIRSLLKHLKDSDSGSILIHRDDCFVRHTDFESMAKSRHSVRWFANGVVDESKVLSAITLAQTAPSACNRQSVRVKIITDKKLIGELCKLQNGNRGFGINADKWLLITSEMGAWDAVLYGAAYLDAGIFAGNLLYALHYYGIAACALNAYLSPSEQRELRRLLEYPKSEIPMLFIAIGNPPNSFKIARSRRLDTHNIITQNKGIL